jgi:hypothetical protein
MRVPLFATFRADRDSKPGTTDTTGRKDNLGEVKHRRSIAWKISTRIEIKLAEDNLSVADELVYPKSGIQR